MSRTVPVLPIAAPAPLANVSDSAFPFAVEKSVLSKEMADSADRSTPRNDSTKTQDQGAAAVAFAAILQPLIAPLDTANAVQDSQSPPKSPANFLASPVGLSIAGMLPSAMADEPESAIQMLASLGVNVSDQQPMPSLVSGATPVEPSQALPDLAVLRNTSSTLAGFSAEQPAGHTAPNPILYKNGESKDAGKPTSEIAMSRSNVLFMDGAAVRGATVGSSTGQGFLGHSDHGNTIQKVDRTADEIFAPARLIFAHPVAATPHDTPPMPLAATRSSYPPSVWGPMRWETAMTQIAREGIVNIRQGHDREIIVKLDPPTLGEVHLRFWQSVDGTHGEIRANHPEAHLLIQLRLPELQHLFEVRGLQPIQWTTMLMSENHSTVKERPGMLATANGDTAETQGPPPTSVRRVREIARAGRFDFEA